MIFIINSLWIKFAVFFLRFLSYTNLKDSALFKSGKIQYFFSSRSQLTLINLYSIFFLSFFKLLFPRLILQRSLRSVEYLVLRIISYKNNFSFNKIMCETKWMKRWLSSRCRGNVTNFSHHNSLEYRRCAVFHFSQRALKCSNVRTFAINL